MLTKSTSHSRLKTVVRSLSLAAAISFVSSTSSAKEFTISSGLPPATAQTMGIQYFADRVSQLSNGKMKFKVYPGNLLGIAETMGGIRDGVVDAGFTVPAYHRAEFPRVNLLIDLAIAGDDAIALTGAASEFLFTCNTCMQEILRQNQIMLGIGALPTYQLMSKTKISDVSDFAGKKIRSFASFGRWVESLGGQMVSVPADTIYEAMSQGQIDANLHPPEQLRSTSFADHMRYLLDLGTGAYIGNSYININRRLWASLSVDERKILTKAASDAIASATVDYNNRNRKVLAELADLKVELVKPSDALVKRTQEFRDKEIATVIALNSSKYGIKDADAQTKRFLELAKKWNQLVSGIDVTNREAVAKLLWDEAFSKLDVSSVK